MSEQDKNNPAQEHLNHPENAIKPEHFQDDIPDMNSKSIAGKVIKWFFVVLALAVGGFLLYVVNLPKPEKKVVNNKTIAPQVNDRPQAEDPPVVEPIGVVGKGKSPSGQSYSPEDQTPPMDWWERKKSGGQTEVNYSRQQIQEKESPTQDDRKERCDPLTGENCKVRNKLSDSLEAATFKASQASFMPDLNYMITSVRNINASLDTAIDSSEAGFISATITEDVYSDNHQVRLIDRGARVDGQYSGQVKNGYARLGVIWTRIKTANSVWININSLGSDALGRSGMSGYVDNKFWDRFGAAFMLSIFKDTSGYAQYRMSGGNNQSYAQNTSGTISNSVEKRMEADSLIPPVLYKNQGDHIQITIARDLDFSPVYTLKLKN